MAALIVAGCATAPAATSAGTDTAADSGGGGNNNNDNEAAAIRAEAVRFAECMRDHGVEEFPDPDASGELTIDGVLNGTGLDPTTPVWEQAVRACEDLQPPGFTGDDEVTADEQQLRLEFAECMRDNGVEDFPDPAPGDPLVDTRKIPSAADERGLSIVNAAMRACGEIAAEAAGR